MLKDLKNVFWILVSVTLLGGCSASAPTGPAEIPGPVALRFPTSVTVDLSTTSSSEFGGLVMSAKRFLGSSGPLSEEISRGTDPVYFLERFLDATVSSGGVLGGISLERSATITQVTDVVPSDSALFAGESLKIDFGQFASEKSETESCSGSTEGSSVCFRCWVNDERLCAGFMTTLPTDANEGAGFIWLDPSILEEIFGDDAPPEGERFQLALRYDKSDAANLVIEGFFGGGLTGDTVASSGHFRILQEGADASTAKKTVYLTSSYASLDGNTSCSQQYIGQWIESRDFWRGRALFDCGLVSESVDACGRISTGEEEEETACQGAGLSVEGEEFIEAAAAADFAFPSDFPLTAPF